MTEHAPPGIVFAQHPAEEADGLRAKGVHVCEMPSRIASVSALHDALSRGLLFPNYYGGNWDALDEMLSDLAWLPAREVAIIHRDIPDLQSSDLVLYLRIVSEAANEAAVNARNLIGVLPAEGRWVRQLLTAGVHGLPDVN